jgi:hypothetical protein
MEEEAPALSGGRGLPGLCNAAVDCAMRWRIGDAAPFDAETSGLELLEISVAKGKEETWNRGAAFGSAEKEKDEEDAAAAGDGDDEEEPRPGAERGQWLRCSAALLRS